MELAMALPRPGGDKGPKDSHCHITVSSDGKMCLDSLDRFSFFLQCAADFRFELR